MAEEEEMTDEEKAMMAALDGDDSQVDTLKAKKDAEEDEKEQVEVHPTQLPQVDESSNVQENNDLNLKMILDIPVDIRVELGNTKLSISDILKLGSGSIVELDRLAGTPADIIVNGKLVGQGDIVIINDNFGIRITKLVAPEERLESL